MSSQKPIFDLYEFTNNLSKDFLIQNHVKYQSFSYIKGSVGELQVLDTLNKHGGTFFARFRHNKFKNGYINIQGFFNDTYFLICVKFCVSKFDSLDFILAFKDAVSMFENAAGIFFCPSGIKASCRKNLGNIKLVESLEELLTVI
ncbi:17368_t:CDS:1 [Dentiscutata erythropus]|uniref:17368_t:CDS:1 n=1 Tax=Dentiscutata erythropus TaxID=1348616 RepID=A0A9N9KAY2_9GLOM|nr:17368_t:CDS:1 [Dentiscutata erythropus]